MPNASTSSKRIRVVILSLSIGFSNVIFNYKVRFSFLIKILILANTKVKIINFPQLGHSDVNVAFRKNMS